MKILLSAAIATALILTALITGDPVVGALVMTLFTLAIAFPVLRGLIRRRARTAREA